MMWATINANCRKHAEELCQFDRSPRTWRTVFRLMASLSMFYLFIYVCCREIKMLHLHNLLHACPLHRILCIKYLQFYPQHILFILYMYRVILTIDQSMSMIQHSTMCSMLHAQAITMFSVSKLELVLKEFSITILLCLKNNASKFHFIFKRI